MKIVCEWILPPSYQLIFRTETMLTMKKLFKAKWAAGSESNRVFNMPESQESLALYISLGFLNCLFPLKRFFFLRFSFVSFHCAPLRHSFVCALYAKFQQNRHDYFLSTVFILLLLHLHNSIYTIHIRICVSVGSCCLLCVASGLTSIYLYVYECTCICRKWCVRLLLLLLSGVSQTERTRKIAINWKCSTLGRSVHKGNWVNSKRRHFRDTIAHTKHNLNRPMPFNIVSTYKAADSAQLMDFHW